MYVYCVESFANIECYSDCSRRGNHLVESLFYGVVYCEYGGLIENEHCVFRELCPVKVLVVGESPSVLL